MATASFDESGNITATGKEALPNVAEGLGASNIKGELGLKHLTTPRRVSESMNNNTQCLTTIALYTA